MIKGVRIEDAGKVITFDAEGRENGFLTELFKDGEKTVVYLSAIKPGGFKGFHLHKIRSARYICLRGKAKITLYYDKVWEEHILDAAKPERLSIPAKVATGLANIGNEEVWLVNYPDPPYDPKLKGEQVEYTREELEKGIVK